jgi:protein gp37
MADNTKIEWTDATWNIITGCSVVSAGCKNCYAMKLAGTRLQHHPSRAGLTIDTKNGPVWNGEVRFNKQWLDQPMRWSTPRMIFVCAHGDLFHESVPDEWIDKVFGVMALAKQHTFQVLTKRPERMRKYCGNSDTPFRVARAMAAITCSPDGSEEFRSIDGFPGYFVSSYGHVYSDRRGDRRRLKPDAGKQGHLRVPLFRDGGPRHGERMLVHRLVLVAFDGLPPSKDSQGRHLDGNPSNNAIGNLTWGGQSENWEDSKRHGSFRRYCKLTKAQVVEIKLRGGNGESAYSIAKDFPVSDTQIRNILKGDQWSVEGPIMWPLGNVWKGVSVENQEAADKRIPILLDTPAAVRWISAEPLLGEINLNEIEMPSEWNITPTVPGKIDALNPDSEDRYYRAPAKLDWVVVGGESGPGARPMHPYWARSLRDQCAAAGVPFLFKQWGEWCGANHDHDAGIITCENGMRVTIANALFNTINHWDNFWKKGAKFASVKLGKKAAGRLLDGVAHDGYPK